MFLLQLRDLVDKRKDEVKEQHDFLQQELEMERKKVCMEYFRSVQYYCHDFGDFLSLLLFINTIY